MGEQKMEMGRSWRNLFFVCCMCTPWLSEKLGCNKCGIAYIALNVVFLCFLQWALMRGGQTWSFHRSTIYHSDIFLHFYSLIPYNAPERNHNDLSTVIFDFCTLSCTRIPTLPSASFVEAQSYTKKLKSQLMARLRKN